MTFDESNSRITDYLTGRKINYVVRNGKELEFYTDDGHCIVLKADVNGDIHFKRQNVKVAISLPSMLGAAGNF